MECFPGWWKLDNTSYAALKSEPGTVATTTGSVVLYLDPEGNSEMDYDFWKTEKLVDSVMTGIGVSGIDVGRYTIASDGTMTITETNAESQTTKIEQLPDLQRRTGLDVRPAHLSQGRYTCDDSEMTVALDGEDVMFYRQARWREGHTIGG